MQTVLGVWRVNLRQSSVPYLIIIILLGSGLVQDVLQALGVPTGSIALGNFLVGLPLLLAIFSPALNLTKIINLGGKRLDIFKGFFLSYAAASVVVSGLSLALYYVLDRYMVPPGEPDLSLWKAFGFLDPNPALGFVQMAAFLFLVACVAHTLTLSQGRWYGWVADVLIIAIISVFTPIAPLRAALVWFFNLIIFGNPALQIMSCIVIGVAVYALSLIPIKTKAV